MSIQSHPANLRPPAYRDPAFMDSDDARPVRILSEYLGPLGTLRRLRVLDTVVFFGSARLSAEGPLGRYYAEARELARRVTAWSRSLFPDGDRFIVCTGGGPGIMEAANRGAAEAGGRTLGLNIGLPHEQWPNPYLTPELSFEFHYFFMRKLWFAHLARAMVVFPGGFGTLDELFEILTLTQTRKLSRDIPILLYGSSFWDEVLDLEALARHGTIAPEDLRLFRAVDGVDAAFELLCEALPKQAVGPDPAFASSKVEDGPGAGPEASP